MKKVWEVIKNNVKVSVTIAAVGAALTLGFSAKGCDVAVAPDAPVAAPAPAPAVPAMP